MRPPRLIFFSVFLAISISGLLSVAVIAENSLSLVPIQSCGHLNATGPSLLNSSIGSNLSAVTFLLDWTNASSRLEMTLTTPDGQKIDSSAQPPVIYGKNESTEYFLVPNPEQGAWTAQVKANSVTDKGEDYCLTTIFILGPESMPGNSTSSEQLNSSALNGSPCPTCGQ